MTINMVLSVMTHSVWMRRLTTAAVLMMVPLLGMADPQKVKQVPNEVVLSADASLQPRTIFLKRFIFTATEAPAGELQRGWLCSGPAPIRFSAATANAVSRSFVRLFRQKIEAAGYPASANATRSAFETDETKREPDFELGVTLKSFDAQLCSKSATETLGGVWMQIRWEVFSPKAQKVLLDLTTEGAYQNDQTEKATVTDMFDRAFSNAAGNLLAKQAYFDLLHGKTEIPVAEKLAALKIRPVEEPVTKVEDTYQRMVDATLTLSDGTRTGSGFFVSTDGYLLTNQHVVAGQKYMKVRLNNGAEMVAELVRSNKARDVALMKVPLTVAATALYLKLKQPVPGEEAYVIGSPLGKTFAGTLTKGVISGFRQLDGVNYIQSDVRILPGSSGGPLFDGKSRVVGMTVAGVGAGAAGINLFIPIEEALKALSLEIE